MLDETKLFDFVKIMFTKQKDFKNIKDFNKKRHHFMINRFFSIKFPANAEAFNINGINGLAVIESWALVAQRFTSVPPWIYTKTKKSETAATNKKEYIPSQEAIEFYMRKNEIGKREFNETLKFFKEDTLAQLKKLDETIKVY
jgi:hypothetical protein